MTNYSVGDFLIRIKNAALANQKEPVVVAITKLAKSVALALKDLKFLESVEDEKGLLSVKLAYKRKKPVLMGLKLVSKPGLRVYMGVDELEKIKKPSIFLISTPRGIISSLKAIKERVGGEVIAEIY